MSRVAGIPAAHPAALWQCGASRFDLAAAKHDLGYEPRVTIAEGLERLRTHLQRD